MKTFTGRYIDPLRLKASDIDIRDIAHHLSNICRFNGACKYHYSVAQHSVYVSNICGSVTPETPVVGNISTASLRLAGLLHDASEAYLMDIPRPIKYSPQFTEYRKIEADVQGLIYNVFGLPSQHDPVVKDADDQMLVTEGVLLMDELYTEYGPASLIMVTRMTPEQAERGFLAEYELVLMDRALVQTRLVDRDTKMH